MLWVGRVTYIKAKFMYTCICLLISKIFRQTCGDFSAFKSREIYKPDDNICLSDCWGTTSYLMFVCHPQCIKGYKCSEEWGVAQWHSTSFACRNSQIQSLASPSRTGKYSWLKPWRETQPTSIHYTETGGLIVWLNISDILPVFLEQHSLICWICLTVWHTYHKKVPISGVSSLNSGGIFFKIK